MKAVIDGCLGDIIPFPIENNIEDNHQKEKSREAPRREGAGPVVIPIIEPVDISHDIYKAKSIDVVSEILKYFK